MDFKSLKLVDTKDIPLACVTPTDNLLDLYKLGMHMEQICLDNNGVGLSAVQVGIPYDFFVIINFKKNEYFFHCTYEGFGEKFKSIEGCLSLKDSNGNLQRYEVERFEKIKIKGKRLLVSDNDPMLVISEFEEDVDNFNAIIYQHEIDHQNGILISQIGKPIYIHRT